LPTEKDPDGYSALQAFDILEAENKRVPCREPELLSKVECGKAQLNWQIRQWSEGVAEGTFFIFEFEEWYPWLPEWVFKAVLRQAKTIEMSRLQRFRRNSDAGDPGTV
jgi:hypothetical protein